MTRALSTTHDLELWAAIEAERLRAAIGLPAGALWTTAMVRRLIDMVTLSHYRPTAAVYEIECGLGLRDPASGYSDLTIIAGSKEL